MSWSTEASAVSQAVPSVIWEKYIAVSRWADWDADLDQSELSGPFTSGSRGSLTPTGGPRLRFEIVEATPDRSFANVTPFPHPLLPLARIEFEHCLDALPTGATRITHRVRIAGLLGPLVARILGPSLVRGLPETVRALAKFAESASGEGTHVAERPAR
jgi:hypothetical protein